MTFDEAAQRFRWLEQQFTSGQINMEQYRSGLAECRVTDQYGRLWMPQERTGEWYVYVNGQWVQGRTLQAQSQPLSPYVQQPQPAAQYPTQGYQAQPVAQYPAQRYQRAQPGVQRPSNMTSTKGGMSVGLSLLFWVIGFAALAVILYLVTKESEAVLGAGVAAAISLIIILANSASSWEGRIEDIRTTRERYHDSDGDSHTRTVTYAYVLQPNGKTKRVQAGHGWQVGDYLLKKRGEMSVRLIKQ